MGRVTHVWGTYPIDRTGTYTQKTCLTCGQVRTMPREDNSCAYCVFGKVTRRMPRRKRRTTQSIRGLKRIREELGISQEELSQKSGVHISTIYRHENEMSRNAHEDIARRLAKVLRVPVSELEQG